MKIGFDLHGTDSSPKSELNTLELIRDGAIEDCEIIPIGKVRLEPDVNRLGFPLVIAQDVVGMHEIPSAAIRKKKNSTIAVGMEMVKKKEIDAFVSAGNTGAVFGFARLMLGKIKGISRPGVGVAFPSEKDFSFLIDVGANINASAVDLYQYGKMGTIFARTIMKIKNPKVALLSIGEEFTKGNEAVKKAHKLLKESNINFVGNVEGGDLMKGYCDVILTNGFVGNILLKFAEEFASTVGKLFRQAIESAVRRKLGGVFIRSALNEVKGKLNYEKYGGGVMLGLPAVVILAHGRSSPEALKNAIYLSAQCARVDLTGLICEAFKE